ncbi:hypothetical protein [Williamsia muralis]|uniref:Uncharacterized protein n=1 Tax=Williamsia marianensis TaxID=85044 RepID=A0A2G3PLH8_WILMA|nr:hypothetical protein [Williamsia marianensis]PHV65942.1 hypothetical protein CSW57_19960 [Williamsia marianensis]
MKKVLKSLSEDEYRLVRETKRKQLTDLDEDSLIALHVRTRRARNKHVKNYRQAAAQSVRAKGGRGAARPATKHNAAKAEAFEAALARVSRQLGVVAKRSAAELKKERLSNAKGEGTSFSGPADGKGTVISEGTTRADKTRKSPGRKKIAASSKAAGKRRQAKKDNR